MQCFRCGQKSHLISNCFARSTVDGQPLPPQTSKRSYGTESAGNGSRSGVYVLQYPNGMFYVGKSSDIDTRIGQHTSGQVACTADWGKPREIAPITSRLDADHESWERNETLEQMQRHGMERVRGWMYTSPELTEEAQESIASQLCKKYDCCRLCGLKGHLVSACPQQGRRASNHCRKMFSRSARRNSGWSSFNRYSSSDGGDASSDDASSIEVESD